MIRRIRAERRPKAIAWSDRFVLFVTTRATAQGRAGLGLRRDAPAFPGEGRGFTRLTDEGLVIEIFDLPDAKLFEEDSATPTPIAAEIGAIIGRLFRSVSNPVAIKGHLRAKSVLQLDNPVWELSTGRAAQMRLMLEQGGLPPARIARLTGAADRVPAVRDATAPRNNRIEVILLRSDG